MNFIAMFIGYGFLTVITIFIIGSIINYFHTIFQDKDRLNAEATYWQNKYIEKEIELSRWSKMIDGTIKYEIKNK